jgi:hypothetical protein
LLCWISQDIDSPSYNEEKTRTHVVQVKIGNEVVSSLFAIIS